MSSSSQTEREVELSEALVRCLLRDQTNDSGQNERELVCEVKDEAWAKAVAKPVDEVTFTSADSDSAEDENSPEQETGLDVQERVDDAIETRLAELGLDADLGED